MPIGDTGPFVSYTISSWDLAEDIRKRSFTQLLDYREDLKNPRFSYADGRDKRQLLMDVDLEINRRVRGGC